MKTLPTKNYAMGSKIRVEKSNKLGENVYKLLMYSILSIVNFFILKQGNFLDKYLIGD